MGGRFGIVTRKEQAVYGKLPRWPTVALANWSTVGTVNVELLKNLENQAAEAAGFCMEMSKQFVCNSLRAGLAR